MLVPAVMAAYNAYKHSSFSIGDGKDIDLWGSLIGNGSMKNVTCVGSCSGFTNTTGTDLVLSGNLSARSVNGVINASAYTSIQAAIDSCPGDGCEIYIPAGTYIIPAQASPSSDAWTGMNVGLKLPSNIIIRGSGNATILQNTTTITGTGGISEFTMITNSNHMTGNTNIVIKDLIIKLPDNKETATGMDAWDNAVVFVGAKNTKIQNIETLNGGIMFRPTYPSQNTPNVLINGSNENNLIRDVISYNVTGSSGFYQSTDSTSDNYRISRCFDDCFLIGSAGKNLNFINNNYNSTSPNGKGASSGTLAIINDNVVCVDNTCMSNIKIIGGNYNYNNMSVTGSRAGIYIIDAENVLVDGVTSANNSGCGILVEGNSSNIKITNSNIQYNNVWHDEGGISFLATPSDTQKDNSILNTFVYNNSRSISARGIEIYSNGVIQNMTVHGNTVRGHETNIYTLTEPAKTLLAHITQNVGSSPFDFGNSAAAPNANGAGDIFFNTTKQAMCVYTTSWTFAGNSTGSC
jgi:hypothetical protein